MSSGISASGLELVERRGLACRYRTEYPGTADRFRCLSSGQHWGGWSNVQSGSVGQRESRYLSSHSPERRAYHRGGRLIMAKILTVDDSAFMRGIIKTTLRNAGYSEIYEAADGLQAIKIYQQLKPDLVMMDITMPNVNGLNTLRAIRTADAGANVVMCTAMGQERMVMEAVRYGAKDFIVKPFKTERVLKVVAAIIGNP